MNTMLKTRWAGILAVSLLGLGLLAIEAKAASLKRVVGELGSLRVNALGSGYGPSTDFIDVEVVVRIEGPSKDVYGFQLRNDNDRPSRQAMFDLLRDAFTHNWTVTIEYWIDPGKKNGIIHRVWVSR